jgi:uncharacterized protein (TIGR02996 family)
MGEADREAFLAAIRGDAADATARLVFTDWLDERGDPDGELARLLCEVQASDYADTRARRSANCSQQLVKVVAHVWVTARRVVFALSSNCPYQALFRSAVQSLNSLNSQRLDTD